MRAAASTLPAAGVLVAWGREVVEREGHALQALAASLDDSFAATVRLLAETVERGGRVLLSGMGKSGLAARKVAATLRSTGAPAVFLHPGEAAHGDLGLVTAGDALVTISRSGDLQALGSVVAAAQRLSVPVVAWTQAADSSLARAADVVITIQVGPEADPDDIIPSASTAAAIALGDAVAIALFRARGLTPDDFARLHPGGILGRRLTLRARDLMHAGSALPLVRGERSLLDVLQVISDRRLGVAVVEDEEGGLAGILTDGDVRRALLRDSSSLHRPVREYMTRDPRTIGPDELVARALEIMERPERRITALVVAEGGRPIGVLHLHDCLQTGLR
ncbi:MAG: KpsF/GutQ family sugar-phosphate isomerase [bacterium]